MAFLPYDYTRCAGQDCDRKDECLRHLSMADMGPQTGVVARYVELGREAECFIQSRRAECRSSR